MAERYTRGEILGARRFAEWELEQAVNFGLCTTASSWRVILAALDAYDPQRPRPASESPEDSETVLVYGRRYPHSAARWWVGHYADYDRCAPVGIPRHEWCEWRTDDHRVITVAMAWLSLPPAPERDDG